jgi:hypothetical protein
MSAKHDFGSSTSNDGTALSARLATAVLQAATSKDRTEQGLARRTQLCSYPRRPSRMELNTLFFSILLVPAIKEAAGRPPLLPIAIARLWAADDELALSAYRGNLRFNVLGSTLRLSFDGGGNGGK